MKIYYNETTRQLIVTNRDYAMSVYLQKDERPVEKGVDLLDIYADHPENISICREILPDGSGQLAPHVKVPKPHVHNGKNKTFVEDAQAE